MKSTEGTSSHNVYTHKGK